MVRVAGSSVVTVTRTPAELVVVYVSSDSNVEMIVLVLWLVYEDGGGGSIVGGAVIYEVLTPVIGATVVTVVTDPLTVVVKTEVAYTVVVTTVGIPTNDMTLRLPVAEGTEIEGPIGPERVVVIEALKGNKETDDTGSTSSRIPS